METISCVRRYQSHGVLLINPPGRTETPQGQMRENNHLCVKQLNKSGKYPPKVINYPNRISINQHLFIPAGSPTLIYDLGS